MEERLEECGSIALGEAERLLSLDRAPGCLCESGETKIGELPVLEERGAFDQDFGSAVDAEAEATRATDRCASGGRSLHGVLIVRQIDVHRSIYSRG
jgi:hypothetical protein